MPVTVLRSLSLVVCEVPQETREDYKKTDKLTGCATCSRLIRKRGIELGLSVPVSLNRTWIITNSLWYPVAFSPQRNKALPRGLSKTKGWLNDATLLLIYTLLTSSSSQRGNTSSLEDQVCIQVIECCIYRRINALLELKLGFDVDLTLPPHPSSHLSENQL